MTPSAVIQISCPKCGLTNSEFNPRCSRCRHALQSSVELEATQASEKWAPFTDLTPIGCGSMGRVYRAWDPELNRYVALKILHSGQENQDIVEEARSAGGLQHPNIVSVYGLFARDGQHYFAMEWVQGHTLQERLKAGDVTLSLTIKLADQVAKALACAHEHGVIHRDLKPANIMVTDDGVAKVLDFGLARRVTSDTSNLATMGIDGTPAYMAPEQLHGDQPSIQADVYAFGKILSEMLEVAGTDAKQVPKGLFDLVSRCLQTDPEDRYTSMSEVCQILRKFKGSRFIETNKNFLVVSLLAACVVAVVIWIAMNQPVDSIPIRVERIAVLPFQSLDADPSNRVYGDGFSSLLSRQLGLLARNSEHRWVLPARELARLPSIEGPDLFRELGVTYVFSGSIRSLGRQRTLQLDLVEASSLALVSSQTLLLDERVFESQQRVLEVALELFGWHVDEGHLQSVLRGDAEIPQAFQDYVLGLGYLYRSYQDGNLARAVDSFQKAVDADPLAVSARIGWSEARLQQWHIENRPQFLEDALAAALAAEGIRNDLASVHVCLGKVRLAQGQLERAMEHLSRALELDPGSSIALYQMAHGAAESGQMERAVDLYHQAATASPGDWFGQTDRANFLFGQGQIDEAALVFQHLIDLAPENAFGYSNLGAIEYYREQLDLAQNLFEKAIELRPEECTTQSNFATLLYYQGEYQRACSTYEQAVSYCPDRYLLWSNFGDALLQVGNASAAKEAFERASALIERRFSVSEGSREEWCDLALLYAKLMQPQRALEVLSKFEPRADDPLPQRIVRAQVYERIGRRSAAIDHLVPALERGYTLTEVTRDPEFSDLVNDPSFLARLK